MITRQQLEVINRKTLKYPLHIAEKDYLLALVLQPISTSQLGQTLIFKGGTAVHHCYLEQYRFSEDLDFSTNQKPVSLDQVRAMFAGVDFLTIRKDYQSPATIKIERLQYTGPLIQPNSLKVEIDFKQNVLLPPQTLPFRNVWGVDVLVQVMDWREICAEKIRAMSDRARYRDFYDLFLLLEQFRPRMNEITDLIERKEIRQPITKVNILNNWRIVQSEKANELRAIYYARPVEEAQMVAMLEDLPVERIG